MKRIVNRKVVETERHESIADVTTREWEFSYDEDFHKIEWTITALDNEDPYNALIHVLGYRPVKGPWMRQKAKPYVW